MPAPAIKIEGLWKEYRVGAADQHFGTFYDLLSHSLRVPFPRSRATARQPAQTDAFWALKDVNLDVQAGEVVGIVGANGAGKSTLLKVLSRITGPTRGRITARGRLASLLEVGTGFHPELSGRENIFLNGAILGMTRKEVTRKFDEIVAFAEVETFIDTPVKRYSSGMYVRLAFAVAAHLEADILMVDEVLAVGDAAFQKRCTGKMKDVAHDGRTVILVSHNLDSIQLLCERVAWMERGGVRKLGPSSEVLQEYLTFMTGNSGFVEQDTGALKLLSVNADCLPIQPEFMEVHIIIQLQCLKPIPDLWIDFGLEAPMGQRLVQVMPAAKGNASIAATDGQTLEFSLRLKVTTLRPNEYVGTVYAHSKSSGVILHVSRVPLFRVAPNRDSPETVLHTFSALLAPPYESSLRIV